VNGVEAPARSLALDHLVVAAHTLDDGIAWCVSTFAVLPQAGGRHAFMGTHNRLMAIGAPGFERSYLEIIAIDPQAAAPARRRWFDLDDAALQRRLRDDGPALVQWVARTPDIEAAGAALRAAGVDTGAVEAAERATPAGLLRWRIGLRADGGRPLGGAAPMLIAWDGVHPVDSLPPSRVRIEALQVGGWPSSLAGWLPEAIGRTTGAFGTPDAPGADSREADAAPLIAALVGPRGRVVLRALPGPLLNQ
jgi:Glyoxalase-like domain